MHLTPAMEYDDFEKILDAYFFKDMLQNMLQNYYFTGKCHHIL